MSKNADETHKPKTSICVYSDTLNKLKAIMKYGDTINGRIDELIDFYDKWKDVVSKIGGDKNE